MINKSKTKHWLFLLLDVAMLAISFFLAYIFRFDRGDFSAVYRSQIIILLFAIAAINLFGNPFEDILKRDNLIELKKVLSYALSLALIDIVCLFITHDANTISRLYFGYMWLIDFVLTFLGRVLLKGILRKKGQDSVNKSPAILITSSKQLQDIIADYKKPSFRTYTFISVFLSDYQEGVSIAETEGIAVLGGLEEAVEFATHNWVDEAFLCIPEDPRSAEKLTDTLCMMGIKVRTILTRICESANEHYVQYPERIGSYVIITQVQRVIPMYQWALKRTLDIVGGILGCAATAILFIFVAPAIYFKDPGPIFYKAKRVGKNGRIFNMYKFRSMYMDADERKQELMSQNKMSDGMMFKIDDDPRIIGSEKKDKNGKPKGIGNFVRETSIDEFPQFWSVLIGDMSLCGTRPPTLDEYVKYSAEHKARLSQRPGITGLWQISGRSTITDFNEIVELDTEYIRTWDFWLDIKILCKTVGAVLRHDGAE